MVDMAAIGVISSSLNTTLNIAKAMVGIRDATVIQEKVFELQRAILETQQGIFSANEERTALIEAVRQLESKLAQFENWEAEKKRYRLKDLGTGVFAYELKVAMSEGEPPHYICASCYQDRQKSILQGFRSTLSQFYNCPRCKAEIRF